MSRRVMIGAFAAMGLVAMWWTDAVAAPVCLQYRTLGGSSVCSKWSTKGVQSVLEFNQDCGPGGVNCSATVSADAEGGNSIAFCQSPAGVITRRECPSPVSFTGETGPGVNQCVPKHTRHGDDDHDKAKHGCTATIVLELSSSCDACCNPPPITGETCVDVTPFEMDTRVVATVESGGGDFTLAPAAASSGGDCSVETEGGSQCVFEEHCSINPKKIALNAIKPYQCSLTCVGEDCFSSD